MITIEKPMQFLLIISHDAHFHPTETLITQIVAWNKAMESRGILKYGNPLRPPNDAVTVRMRHGKLELADGPFTDSTEKMAAYALVECATLDAAVEVASLHPMAKAATIEVRPVWAELASEAMPA